MKYADITKCNMLLNKVQVDLHMFGALVLDGVRRHVDCANVAIVY
jgi:hypothetical protein